MASRILSGADFGVRFPTGGGVANNDFGTQLSRQLLGQAVQGQQQEDQFNRVQAAQAQKAEQIAQVTGEKNRLTGMFTQLERIKGLTLVQQKKELALLGQSEINAGRDGSEFIEALNGNTPDEMNLNISRLSTKAGNLAGQFDEVLKANAPPKAQTGTGKAREDLTAGLITQPEFVAETTAKGAAPFTTIGKARADLEAGRITQEDFNSLKNAPKGFKTDIGKSIADKQLATDIYGADSEQVKAIQAAIDSDAKGEEPKLSDVGGMRKEFTKLSGDFIKLRDAISKVESARDNPSPAGDLSLIFNFMKIQDPASVVRESEFETAQNSTSLPGRLGAGVQRVLSGERMLPEQRADFVDTALRLFGGQTEKQRQLEGSFAALAERQDINPSDVVIDFIGNELQNLSDEELLKLVK